MRRTSDFADIGRQLRRGLAALLAWSAWSAAPAAETPRPPNVLLILADDLGPGDLRNGGNAKVDTPHLDRLAAAGTRFTDFQVCPLCAPTRASLLTGRYHLRGGVTGVTHGRETLRAEEYTLAEIFRDSGYATGCFGKWHNGGYYPQRPEGQGFDAFFGFCGGHLTNYFGGDLEENGRPIRDPGFVTDVLAARAGDFIRRYRDRPFFCYVPFNAPHAPYQVPDALFEKYRARGFDAQHATVYGLVDNLDANVGKLLALLDELKLSDDTLVIFASDNGPHTDRFNGGLKGRKGSLDEGGTRAPLFLRLPGKVPAGRTDDRLVGHVDLLPTLIDLCGLKVELRNPLDGVSQANFPAEDAAPPAERTLYFQQAKEPNKAFPGALRRGKLRAIFKENGTELYDLAADPGQRNDLAGERPELAATLRQSYLTWFADATRTPPLPPAIGIGYEAARTVTLQASDARLAGGVRFRAKQGYAHDWIVNWTRPADEIRWPLDVVRGCRCRVELLYSCPEKDIGATVRVTAGGGTAEGRLTSAHDPDPLPSPNRFPQPAEAPEKVWKSLSLGELTLEPGETELKLQAVNVPGTQVMELKGVRLIRVD